MVSFLLPFTFLVIERHHAFPVIVNPDGVNYSILAREYSQGHFHNAINGYWGPAISWGMAVPMTLGAGALDAYRAITLLILYLSLFLIWRMTERAAFRSELQFLALWTAGLMTLGWSVDVMTPDLLMLLVMLLFFMQFSEIDVDLDRRRVVLLGVFGGIGFLVKPFGLLFFLAAYSMLFAYLWLRHRREMSVRRLAKGYLSGVAVFLGIALPWIAAMSWKYGHVTTGSSGQRNLTLVAPPTAFTAGDPPAMSLSAPPFPGAVEGLDPTLSQAPTWNPFESPDDLQYFGRNFLNNIESVIRLFWPTLLVLGVVATLALAGLMLRSRSPLPELPIRAVLFAAAYVGLYCLVLVETRYLWPVIMVLCLGGFTLVNGWSRAASNYRWVTLLLAIPLAFILVAGPYWRPAVGVGGNLIDLMYAPEAYWRRAATEGHTAAAALGDDYAGTRIAANDARWQSMYIAFFTDSEYYGEVIAGEPHEVTQNRLRHYEIDVFLYWGAPDEQKPSYLTQYSLSEELHDGWLRVYTRDGVG